MGGQKVETNSNNQNQKNRNKSAENQKRGTNPQLFYTRTVLKSRMVKKVLELKVYNEICSKDAIFFISSQTARFWSGLRSK
jgi:hypothetical protein